MYKTIDEENEAWDDLLKWKDKLHAELQILEGKFSDLSNDSLASFMDEMKKISTYVVLIKAFSGSFTKNIGPGRGKKAIVALVNESVDAYVTFYGEKLAMLNNLTSYRTNSKLLNGYINDKFDSTYSSKWFPGGTLSDRLSVEVEKIIFYPESLGTSQKQESNLGTDGNDESKNDNPLLRAILDMAETQMLQFKTLHEKNAHFEREMQTLKESSDSNLEKVLKSSEYNITKLINESKSGSSLALSNGESGLAKTIATVHSHSNLSRFDLPKEEKYNGHHSKLIPFIKHITNKIIPSINDHTVRWESVIRNIEGDILGVARQCAINADDYENALIQFLKRIIEGYGHRFDIAIGMINDFLNGINFDHKDQLECLNFLSQINMLKSNLEFIGSSDSLHNIFFLHHLLAKLPIHVKNSWIRHEAKSDNLIRKIFDFSKENGLMYNVNKRKNPNYAGVDRSENKPNVQCPNNANRNHEISFDISTFIDWFENFYIAGGIFKTENTLLCNVNTTTSSKAHYSNVRDDRDVGQHNTLAMNQSNKKFKNKIFYTSNKTGYGANTSRQSSGHPGNQISLRDRNSNFSNQQGNKIDKDIAEMRDVRASRDYYDRKVSIFHDSNARNWTKEKKLIFLYLNLGCLKCGFNHRTQTCKQQARGYPCKNHPVGSEVGKFHNEAVHVENWPEIREKLKRGKNSNRASTAAIITEVLPENEDDHGYDVDDSNCVIFDGGYSDLNHDFYEEVEIAMAAFEFCNKLENWTVPRELNPAVANYRPFARVILSNKNKDIEIPTLVMFDTGSTKSFICETARKRCFIEGFTTSIHLSGVNQSNLKNVKICECIITNPDTKTSYKLKNIGSLSMGNRELIPNYTIPTKRVVNATPGLESLEWPDNPEALILLGIDYYPLFHGPFSEDSTLNTVIQHTPIGTKIGGLLGNDEMIRARYTKIANLMACGSLKASVSLCTQDEFERNKSISDYFVENEEKVQTMHDIKISEIAQSCINDSKVDSVFQNNSSDLINLEIPKHILEHFSEKEADNQSNQDDIPGVVDDDCDDDIFEPNSSPITFDPIQTENETISETQIRSLDVEEIREGYIPNTPMPKYKNYENLTIPNTVTKENEFESAKMYEMQEWQKILLDNMPTDVLDCIEEPRDDFMDLENHSFLDKKGWSREQRYTFQKCVRGAHKTSDGRYVIPIIFNEKIKKLSNSKYLAESFLKGIDEKIKKDPEYARKYKEYMQEMIDTGVVEDVPLDEIENKNKYYLAYFEVITGCGDNGQGKFRIVFNAAAKLDNLSLNDCITSGPDITASILSAAMRFRERKFVVMGDIKKMFFQFKIPENQRDFCRILVHENFDPNLPLKEMRFTRIPFGIKIASMMAALGLQLCARDNLSEALPHVVKAFILNTMVDDYVYTSDTAQDAAYTGLATRELGLTCGLSFEKFDSNCMDVLEMIPKELWAKNAGPTQDLIEMKPPVENNETLVTSEARTKLLGTMWNKRSDTISLKVQTKNVSKITKRSCLSQQNSIFDMYGIGAATTLIPKLLIQKMHKMKLEWDKPLPKELVNSWLKWLRELPTLSKIVVNRPIIKKPGSLFTDVHVYTDASIYAEGFVAFFRTVYPDEIDVVFGFARSAVVPLSCNATCQKLELDAILFACEKILEVTKTFSFEINKTYLWSDSQYSLNMITSITPKLSIFEANRLEKIHLLSRHFFWAHIPGNQNPADAYSRGVYPKELMKSRHLLQGPENLKNQNPLTIFKKQFKKSKNGIFTESVESALVTTGQPIYGNSFTSLLLTMGDMFKPKVGRNPNFHTPFFQIDSVCSELQPKETNHPSSILSKQEIITDSKFDCEILQLCDNDIEKQSWDRYVRDVLIFLQNSEPDMIKNASYSESIQIAKNKIFGAIQRKSWSCLYRGLKSENFRCPVNLKGDFKALRRISAFLETNSGLIKCFGRHADIEGEFISNKTFEKLVLPDKNPITRKLILSVHNDLQHIGQVTVSAFLGRDYWILRSLQYVTNVIMSCKPCLAQKAVTENQQMSVLPRVRTIPFMPPFSYVGLDVAGPFNIKFREGRNVTKKTFVMILSCLNTRAVEFKILRNMTSDAFLLAFETLNYRRNKVIKEVYCDLGTNFVGGAAIISQEEENNLANIEVQIQNLPNFEELTSEMKKRNIIFDFCKPNNPASRGHIERLVGIFKIMLFRVIGPCSKINQITELDNTEFEWILSKIAYGMNQRPLTPVSPNNDDIDYICPADFLQIPLVKTDNFLFSDLTSYLSESRTLCEKYGKQLWGIWEDLYMPSLFERQKWFLPRPQFKIGDFVLYKTRGKFVKLYPVGKIIKLIESRDHIHRNAVIETKEGHLVNAPIGDLSLLEGVNKFEQ